MAKTSEINGTARAMPRTAEHVSQGHPDKFLDQVADAIIDAGLDAARSIGESDDRHPNHFNRQRFAIEGIVKDHLVVVSGECRMGHDIARAVDIDAVVRRKWEEVGYPDAEKITVLNHLRHQSPELQNSSDNDGAGDQGIMVGYATRETSSRMPMEYEFSRTLCRAIQDLRADSRTSWIRADAKTQITLDADDQVTRVVIAVQHAPEVGGTSEMQAVQRHIKDALLELAIKPLLGNIPAERVVVNGTGSFVIGGPIGDAGVVGRKIVVDAYGPQYPVGGGAYSGKDPTKVDRSAAYMARHIAKTAVEMNIKGAKKCLVHLAYAIGQHQPEMVTAVSETGEDLSDWVRSRFPDLSPRRIGEYLELWRNNANVSWRYQDTSAFGHYGRPDFPWERMATVSD
jgi:S-adenosylmethionine synthetase